MPGKPTNRESGDFQALATQKRPGILGELGRFVVQNGKWWLLPLIVIFLVIGVIIMLGGTAAAPFIYSLF